MITHLQPSFSQPYKPPPFLSCYFGLISCSLACPIICRNILGTFSAPCLSNYPNRQCDLMVYDFQVVGTASDFFFKPSFTVTHGMRSPPPSEGHLVQSIPKGREMGWRGGGGVNAGCIKTWKDLPSIC